MHDKLEKLFRKKANALRLEAEKRRAAKDRLDDSRLVKGLDIAVGRLATKRMNVNAGPLMDAVTKGDQSAVWRLERYMLQREAISRGLLKKSKDGKWEYEATKVKRDNRPAERLVKGKVKGKKRSRGPSA